DFHPEANVAKMAAGQPLKDADRAPWLAALAAALRSRLRAGRGVVLACSALRRAYRDSLRTAGPGVAFLYLRTLPELARRRVAGRRGHYFPPGLVESQFGALEEPDPDAEPDVIVAPADAPLGTLTRDWAVRRLSELERAADACAAGRPHGARRSPRSGAALAARRDAVLEALARLERGVVAGGDADALPRARPDAGPLLARADLEAAEAGEGDLVAAGDLGHHRVQQGIDGLLDGLARQLRGADDFAHEVRFADGLGLGHVLTLPFPARSSAEYRASPSQKSRAPRHVPHAGSAAHTVDRAREPDMSHRAGRRPRQRRGAAPPDAAGGARRAVLSRARAGRRGWPGTPPVACACAGLPVRRILLRRCLGPRAGSAFAEVVDVRYRGIGR